ncbi:dGTP triphosphohydrolase [Rhizobium johnstonii]|uniref:dGTP triphosphohydrolase n=1 Tax=Rhizobium johnstonii TaxID=3019933 RepID=UPI003F9474B2
MRGQTSKPKNTNNLVPLYSVADGSREGHLKKDGSAEPFRSGWRRDIARLIHCPAFRRLQGKTQVFPEGDSDFFRNRLTHSLEVAQIAKSFAIRLNSTSEYFQPEDQKIIPEIVEFAALAHDLGHPPFGHNGEDALDGEMADYGGFEGNAQTLHILTRLEKKELLDFSEPRVKSTGNVFSDNRAGLNITHRGLAAVLKYDNCIARRKGERSNAGVQKGYYYEQKELVSKIKKSVLGSVYGGEFKTIECSIMDISDDIAYSTYDMEDCFKAGILDPLSIFSLDGAIYKKVVGTINKRIKKYYQDINVVVDETKVQSVLFGLFSELFAIDEQESAFLAKARISRESKKQQSVLAVDRLSKRLARDGYDRTALTSQLVQRFMDGVEIIPHEKFSQLHRARLKIDTFVEVECLKNITYEYVIMSPSMQTIEHRGKD